MILKTLQGAGSPQAAVAQQLSFQGDADRVPARRFKRSLAEGDTQVLRRTTLHTLQFNVGQLYNPTRCRCHLDAVGGFGCPGSLA